MTSSTPRRSQAASSAAAAGQLTAVCCLDVLRGSTRFPRRAFPLGRFLIGSGAECDVRLGGDDIPLLHSILLIEADLVLLEMVAPGPLVTINGESRQVARLQVDDIVAIGEFEFVVRPPGAAEMVIPPASGIDQATSAGKLTSVENDALALRSALELVEAIEDEMESVEDFGSRRRLGAEALLQAALQRAADNEALDETSESLETSKQGEEFEVIPAATAAPSADLAPAAADNADAAETQLALDDLDTVISRLDSFSQQLERRSRRLAEREANYLAASAELLKAQRRLAANLDMLQKQIDGLDGQPPDTLRASA